MAIKQKILLTNSFAVNNGDLALTIGLYEQLKKLGYSVSIATFYYDFLSIQYPNIPFVRELLDYRFLNRVSFLKKLFLKINFNFNKEYREHDIFISSPGGYVNSYYGIKRCLLPLILAKRDGKKTAVYAQSVGPLNARDSRLLTKFSRNIDVIMVRDAYSHSIIRKIPCHSTILRSKDAAFLLPPRMSTASASSKLVAVSVRQWGFDDRNMNLYQELVSSFCRISLEQGLDIEFISTCQGVPKYRDDSKEAEIILNILLNENPNWYNRITVNKEYHTYYDLTDQLNSKYIFTIGTRLHMCILSMINGIPAFNISYERKGAECYKYLGIDACSVDFNEPIDEGIKKFRNFIGSLDRINQHVKDQVRIAHEESKESLNKFLETL